MSTQPTPEGTPTVPGTDNIVTVTAPAAPVMVNAATLTPVVDSSKRWYESKVIWFNVAAFVAMAIQSQVSTTPLPPEYQALAVAAANVILRAVTDKRLT